MSTPVVDDLGATFALDRRYARIVSLVPSETETVVLLGAGDRLVGRTDYCVAPVGEVDHVPSVGGTKNADLDRIAALAPDLVLANREENTAAIVDGLRSRGLTVHTSFPRTVEQSVALVHDLAEMLRVPRTHAAIATMERGIEALARRRRDRTPLRVFCPIWMDPLMTVHGDTFISDALDLAGGANVFADRIRRYPLAADLGLRAPLPPERTAGRDVRYPRITLDELVARAPDVVLLPDEPHPFTADDVRAFAGMDLPAARSGRIAALPGRDLCWYSPAMASGIARVADLLDTFR